MTQIVTDLHRDRISPHADCRRMRFEPHGYPGSRHPIAGDPSSLQLPDQLAAVLAYQQFAVGIGAQIEVDPRWPGSTAQHTNPPAAGDIVVAAAETGGDPAANIPKFTTPWHLPTRPAGMSTMDPQPITR